MVYGERRERMVQTQIMLRGIKETPILDAFRRVPRHLFVPPYLLDEAYHDCPLPIGQEQTISQPYIVALMTQHLELKPTDRILEIGTGCGYQTAILAELVKEVYSIEIIEELGEKAKELLTGMNYNNIHFMVGDGFYGWKEMAPFDGMIITAAPTITPQPLIAQLKVNSKMVIPVGSLYQSLIQFTKQETGELKKQWISDVRFVPMTGKVQNLEN
ncbi:MAG: protein-L-isoaspartate(D-aspartate) O-methyltransferase [Deltaproteobacteria bacterium]|nr:protein-L-isoaspartate(D-aspartate) O-methyltransferase [Deltaproteobacteria bacterium]